METKSNSNVDTAVNVVSAVFGTAHFIFQSLADITLYGEVKTVQAITKNTPSYRTNEQIIKERQAATTGKQIQIMASIDKMKAMAKPKVQPAV